MGVDTRSTLNGTDSELDEHKPASIDREQVHRRSSVGRDTGVSGGLFQEA